jgi:putative tryptophan/tyrosine transport system substrate-binding protein
MRDAETTARGLGLRLVVLNASSPSEIETAFTSIEAQQIGALLTTGAALFGVQGAQLAALAARHAVPAIYHVRLTVEAGGLMSSGTIPGDPVRLAFVYAGRILKGEKPGDLPVQQSTRFQMVLNLKTAKALGLEVPTATLLRADKVIE